MQKRITRSKELIIRKMTVTEAAKKSGFSGYSGFYRDFKHITEKLPRKFISLVM